MRLLDGIPLGVIIVFGIALSLAPFYTQPHLLQKLQMLYDGRLHRPLDIFDLVWHSMGLVLIALKLVRLQQLKKSST